MPSPNTIKIRDMFKDRPVKHYIPAFYNPKPKAPSKRDLHRAEVAARKRGVI